MKYVLGCQRPQNVIKCIFFKKSSVISAFCKHLPSYMFCKFRTEYLITLVYISLSPNITIWIPSKVWQTVSNDNKNLQIDIKTRNCVLKFTSQTLYWKSRWLDPCIEEHVIFFSRLLPCSSSRNLPTLNIVLLLACAVNVGSVAPDIYDKQTCQNWYWHRQWHIACPYVSFKYRYKDLVGILLRL